MIKIIIAWCTTFRAFRRTPVKAVPASAQAKGSRYQGETEIIYRLAATEPSVVATAPQALSGLISKTCEAYTEGPDCSSKLLNAIKTTGILPAASESRCLQAELYPTQAFRAKIC